MASEPGRLLVYVARAGIFTKGVLYMVVGWLAASAALGSGGRLTGSEGALVSVLRQPYGRILLLIAALGLFGYACWRIAQAIADPDGDGTSAKGLALRASYAVRGIVHAALGWQALRLQRGLSATGGGESDAADAVFALPFGESILVLVGVGLIGYAGFEAWSAWSCRLPRDLDTRRLRAEAGDWAVTVSRFGLAARSVVFAVIGSTAIQAGLSGSASEMKGTEGALRILLHQQGDAGRWILAVVALGLIAYGFYQLVHSRYLQIRKLT